MSTAAASEIVPHHYVVVFKQSTPADVCSAHCEWAHQQHRERVYPSDEEAAKYAGVKHTYQLPGGFAGYAGSFDADLVRQFEAAEEVDFVEPDYKVYASKIVTENAASWGLARISSKAPLDEGAAHQYKYDSSAGEGVPVYVIDTGILAEHEDFEGRAEFGHNAVPGSSNTDKNGHGTHCAGTVGGKKYGVAKKCQIIGVKVLGDSGSGSNSGVIAGLNWAAEDAMSKGVLTTSVASMSLGGTYSRAMNQAVASIVGLGMTVCVAAGNDGSDAKDYSPASEPTAITVGNTTIKDHLAQTSNYGKLVDILAPGTAITSAWIDRTGGKSTSSTNTISGTSMATPHVAGLAAYLIKLEGLDGAQQVTARIKQLAGRGNIQELRSDTVNALAYNGAAERGAREEEEQQAEKAEC